MRRLQRWAGLAFLLTAAACGGGGSAGPPLNTTFVDAEAGGIYGADFITLNGFAGDATLTITEDGRFFMFEEPTAAFDGFYMSGEISVGRDSFTGRGRQIAVPGFPDFVLDDGQTTRSLTVRIQGSVNVDRQDLEGSFTADGLSGVGTFTARAANEQTELHAADSSLAAIAGTYEDIRTGTLLNIAIDAAGVVTGNNANCDVVGQVSLIDAAYNVYDVALTVASCPALVEDDYGGFLTLDSDAGNALLILVADNGADSILNYALDRI